MPAYSEFSWEFALDRLLAGYAMQVSDGESTETLLQLAPDNELQPLDVVEGMNAAYLDGFLAYWQCLMQWRTELKRASTAGDWALRLHQLLDDFYVPEEEETRALNAVHQQIGVLEQVSQQQWHEGNIPLLVIQDVIKPLLQQADRARHHWREGIKFCSLLPMRGVPFKVVYVLGMNLGDYPRRVERKSFDLMRKDHRPGDRATRTDDRWLFLEALLSARQFFHVSYCGRDMYRNEASEPSVVLSELLDYIRHGYEASSQVLVTQHPLQPFGEDYFCRERTHLSPQLVSFNSEALLIAQAKQQRFGDQNIPSRWQAKPAMDKAGEITLSLEEFVTFFTKPARWFFNYRHRLRLRLAEDEVEDEEIYRFSGGLENWQLRQHLIERINTLEGVILEDQCETVLAKQTDELVRIWKARGCWPVGLAGEKAREKLQAVKDTAYFFVSQGKSSRARDFSLPISTSFGQLTLIGNEYLREREYLLHSASNNGADKQLDFVIRYMTLLCSDIGGEISGGRAVFAGGKKPFLDVLNYSIADVDTLKAKAWLRVLATLYLQYRDSGLPFHPVLGHRLSEIEEDYPDEIEDAINEQWYGKEFQTGWIKDIEARSYFGSIDALKEKIFETCCRQIWSLPQ
jgi:exonuclease V gamma subunit